MIYVTGDTHGSYDLHKLNAKNFPEQRALTKSDYVIVLGDFGLVWNNSDEEMYWRKWLDETNSIGWTGWTPSRLPHCFWMVIMITMI